MKIIKEWIKIIFINYQRVKKKSINSIYNIKESNSILKLKNKGKKLKFKFNKKNNIIKSEIVWILYQIELVVSYQIGQNLH